MKSLRNRIACLFGTILMSVSATVAQVTNNGGWDPVFGFLGADGGGSSAAKFLCSTNYNGSLYFAGTFKHIGPSAGCSECVTDANSIIQWTGADWVAVGGGLTKSDGSPGTVNAMCEWDFGSGPVLVVVGDFTTAGTTSATDIATWNGTSWSSVSLGGYNSEILYSVAGFDDDPDGGDQLYVGGTFAATPLSITRVIRRSNSSGSWSAVGPDFSSNFGTPWVLKVVDVGESSPRMCVGGLDALEGGPLFAGAGYWGPSSSGFEWKQFADGRCDYDGPTHPVRDFVVWESEFVTGGTILFFESGCSPPSSGCVWTWDRSGMSSPRWDDKYLGLTSQNRAFSLATFDDTTDHLYVGGSMAGSGTDRFAVHRIDGSTPDYLCDGVNVSFSSYEVRTLIIQDGWLYAAGDFPVIGTGSDTMSKAGIARWKINYAGCSQCRADFNLDGVADFADYLDFVAAFSGESVLADFNLDGVVDFFDYLDFIAATNAGCE